MFNGNFAYQELAGGGERRNVPQKRRQFESRNRRENVILIKNWSIGAKSLSQPQFSRHDNHSNEFEIFPTYFPTS
jgi:hypothetical protein